MARSFLSALISGQLRSVLAFIACQVGAGVDSLVAVRNPELGSWRLMLQAYRNACAHGRFRCAKCLSCRRTDRPHRNKIEASVVFEAHAIVFWSHRSYS